MEKQMIIFSFTRAGTELNRRLLSLLRTPGEDRSLSQGYAPGKYAGREIRPLPEDMGRFIGERWGSSTFVFIGAAGIAVRFIAPWVKDKFTDPAVLVLDEKGEYVIPLLSGHMGGAAALADRLAALTGGKAVHTTATDVQGRFAVDVFARENQLLITDRKTAKEISAAVLEGERIGLCVESEDCRIHGVLPRELVLCRDRTEAEQYPYQIVIGDRGRSETTLLLRPGNVIAGIGCRRGISPKLLEEELNQILGRHGLIPEQLEVLVSIDRKKDEPAILALSEKLGIPFLTYTAEELNQIPHVSGGSEFVLRTTGTDNVCERAALLYGREKAGGARLIQEKWICPSAAIALARRPLDCTIT